MKGRLPDGGKEVPRLEVPEDVAVLYAWANLQGARYRDFSASRRESRAQMRQRAAQSQREVEALAKAKAEESAAEAEREAVRAVGAARLPQAQVGDFAGDENRVEAAGEQAARERALQHVGELSRRAARERAEAARLSDRLRAAEELARREAHEVAEAHASAQRQMQRYAGSEARSAVALQEEPVPLGTLSDPYMPGPQSPPARVLAGASVAEEDMRPERFPQRRAPRIMAPPPEPRVEPGPATVGSRAVRREADTRHGGAADLVATGPHGTNLAAAHMQPSRDQPQQSNADQRSGEAPGADSSAARPPAAVKGSEGTATPGLAAGLGRGDAAGFVERRLEPRPAPFPEPEERLEPVVPAWIHGQDGPVISDPAVRSDTAPFAVADTLQHSRERVASRWYALRGVFDPATPEMEPTQARARETASPVLAVFSLAGGVGKTSLTASLGRSLSAVGEKVLLADLTAQGILPFYFGATELRPGVVRTFNPPPGSADAPVSMVSHDLLSRVEAGEGSEDLLIMELVRGKDTFEHVLIDLSPAATTVLKGLARLDATVLVPVAPDMNTVISLASMERFFAGMIDSSGRALQPRYLLTQFEASLPLHLDVREGLRQKLGHRLLPFVIRRSAEVSEALAEGMTVIDYAPESGVAADYRNLASWLRSLAAPTHPETRAARWSER